MSFSANYFDGKSSRTYQATIYPNSSSWRIVYEDELLGKKEVSWIVNNIKKSEVYTKGLVTFSYGNTFPFQKIESSDAEFINYISKSELGNINSKIDTWLHKSTTKSITLLLAVIVSFTALMYFFIIPTIAVSFAKNLPKQRVVEFGNYVFRVLSNNLEIDEKQSQNLQDFVDAMELKNEFPLTVYVANEDQMNAFALSGGKFVIYSGLLEKIQNEHQLAALIGHEVSHIEKRHVLKNVARSLSGAIFMSVLLGDVSGATSILGENAHKMVELSHSRSLEKEADVVGLEILDNNNLDQHGMPELFQILKDESPIDVPTFLSSHPMLKDRIEYTKKVAEKQRKISENRILKEKWSVIQSNFSLKDNEEKNNELDE